MLYITLLFAFIVVYLMMFMRRQKEKMSEIKIQKSCPAGCIEMKERAVM